MVRAHGDEQRDRVLALLVAQHYDSESVKTDLALDTGNLNILRKDMRHFIRDFDIDARAFSTGLDFQYHAFYAEYEEKGFQIPPVHQEGFGLLKQSALFVPARFESIKSEVLNSGLVTAADFEEMVAKAERYFETADCKAMYSKETYDRDRGPDPLHFGYTYGDELRVEHLHSLLLYTDFTALCTDFSSSFRAVYRGESLESIKERNGRYHHFAKHLKELVMYFGVCGIGDVDYRQYGQKDACYDSKNHSKGPFYCGMSCVLNIPQFSIRLNGPTSTSLRIEVAMRFGGVEGMIIQLNNELDGWYE